MRLPPLHYAIIWHSYLLFGILGLLASLWLIPASICAILCLFLDKRLWQWQRLLLASIIFTAAFCYANHYLKAGEAALQNIPAWTESKKQRICGQVQSAQGLPGNRLRVLLENVHPENKKGQPLPGLCAWTWENPLQIPLADQKICLSGQINPVSSFANQKEDSSLAALFSRRIYWRIWSLAEDCNPEISGQGAFFARLRQSLYADFLNTLKTDDQISQSRAILLALLFGDRQYLDQATVDNFASATLAHSLALSGQHLGLVIFAACLFVSFSGRIIPNLYLKQPRKILIFLAAIPLACVYLWLGNAPASLQRAAAMLALTAFLFWRRKSFSGLDLLCAALLALLLLNPLAIFDVGLQMSALCVAVIFLAAPGLSRLFNALNRNKNFDQPDLWLKIKRGLLATLLISLIIQLALLPLSLSRFQIAGLWFSLNILWLPVLAFLILPGAALGLLVSSLPGSFCSVAAQHILQIAALPCQWALNLLNWLNTHGLLSEPVFLMPFWPNLLAFALLAAGLGWIFGNQITTTVRKQAKRLLGLALLFLAIAPLFRFFQAFDKQITITALDVGQGQSILLTLPDNLRLLIDGGGTWRGRYDPGRFIVAPQTSQNTAPQLAAVINSHPDLDHLGGLFYILENFKVNSLFHNGHEAEKNSQERWRSLQKNAAVLANKDILFLGPPQNNLILEVLHPGPMNSFPAWWGNGASLILRLVKEGVGLALFTGDADKSALQYLLDQNLNLQSKIVFAPHHGSDRNLLADFYKAAKPELVIACCGLRNHWRYPGKKLRKLLNEKNVPLLDTGNSGKITVQIESTGKLKIQTIK